MALHSRAQKALFAAALALALLTVVTPRELVAQDLCEYCVQEIHVFVVPWTGQIVEIFIANCFPTSPSNQAGTRECQTSDGICEPFGQACFYVYV